MENRYINESSDGIQEISLEAKQLSDRKVFLIDEVTENMANEFTAKMIRLVESSDPIDIILNSPGGSVNAGLVIYDACQWMGL